MWGITIHHYFRYILNIPNDPRQFAALPTSANKLIVELVFLPIGKISVVIFFVITAWFLSSSSNFKNDLRRIWLLEREVLFWSTVLLIVSVTVYHGNVPKSTIIRSFFPTITVIWWYVTSYAIFLILHPFITKGLRALGEQTHKYLCIATFAMWSVIGGFLPQITMDMPGNSVFEFLYLYILTTYVRWYLNKPSKKMGYLLIGIGSLIIILWVGACELLTAMTGRNFSGIALNINTENKLPVILIGFGIFFVCINHEWNSRAVNTLAQSALAVFLITIYPALGRTILIWFDAAPYYSTAWFIPLAVGVTIVVYLGCTAADLIRQLLFTYTLDRHKGRWFDSLWRYIAMHLPSRQESDKESQHA